MNTLWQDLRFGIRMLLKRPGFTIIAVLTLALGIGANSAIFSVVNAVLIRPFSYADPDRLVFVRETLLSKGITDAGVSLPDFREWRNRNHSFERVAAFSTDSYNISGTSEPERVVGAVASIDLFPLLGVNPVQGRTFTPDEEVFGKHHVVIVSESFWQKRFGSGAQLGEQTIKLNGEIYNVVGVMPRNFQFPDRNTTLWVPLALPDGSPYNTRGNYWLNVVARLKTGIALTQAQADLDNIHHQLEQEIAETSGFGAKVVSLQEAIVGDVQKILLTLLGAVGFVLLIACANVANLLLARSAARQKEIAIRTTLGAGRLRLVRQLFTESLLLGLLGAICGLLLAVWGVDLLINLGPDLPRINEISIDSRVLIFTGGLAILTSLIFGLVPAVQISKSILNDTLKESGRGTVGSIRRNRARNVLVSAEIALSLVLLVSAGLMLNSLYRLQSVNPGFKTENILTMELSLSKTKYPSSKPELTSAFYQGLVERLKNLPGVVSVGMTTGLPFTESGWGKLLTIEGRPTPKSMEDLLNVQYRQTNTDYFKTLDIPLVKGRLFDASDTQNTLPVALINETMARQFFPNEDPLGKRFLLGPPEEMVPAGMLPPGYRFIRWTIVGVIGDVKHRGLNKPAAPEVFTLQEQSLKNDEPARNMYFAIHTSIPPASLVSGVRRQVQEIDSEQPISNILPMTDLISSSLSQARFTTLLLSIFGVIALILATIGIYGVMSYSVAQRTHEIGIRMALGAQTADVLKDVIKQGMLLDIVGTLIGLVLSFALTRVIASLLYDVSATDLFTFTVVPLLLMVIGLLACYIPARRATRVDPMIALRYE